MKNIEFFPKMVNCFGEEAENPVDKAARGLEEKNKDKQDEKVGDSKKDDKKKDDEPTDEEIKELVEAQNILRILKDPVQRKAFITTLAQDEGITKDSTKTEKKEAVKSIKSIVKQHLGDEYEILREKLENILEDAFGHFEETKVRPVGERLTKKEAEEVRDQASAAYDKVFGEYTNAKSLEGDVAKLIDEIKPSKGMSPEVYFRRLLKIAADEKGVALAKPDAKSKAADAFNKDRRDLNRKDVSSRIANEGADDDKVKQSNTKMSLEDAVLAGARAAEGLLKK